MSSEQRHDPTDPSRPIAPEFAPPRDFTGKVALVTGASTGLGRATALLLARDGADIVLCARGRDRLELVADSIRSIGRQALVVTADVSSEEDRQRLVSEALHAFGHLDYLVATATNQDIYLDGAPTEAQWEAHFSVDLVGAVRLADDVVPGMQARGYGSIVFVSSVSGKTGAGGVGDAGYSAIKAALISAAKSYALGLAKDGIRVNSIAPGTFYDPDTPVWATLPDSIRDDIQQTIPMGRLGRPEEVAQGICFLLSDEASFVTGHCLVVDGGQYPGVV